MKLVILTTLVLFLSSCGYRPKAVPHADHLPGLSCPREGHGDCPFGCFEKKGGRVG